MLVENGHVPRPGLQVDELDIEGDLVFGVEGGPKLLRPGPGSGGGDGYPPGFSLKGGQGTAVALVGMDEMACPGDGFIVFKEIAAAARRVAVHAFEDGQVVAAVGLHHPGNAGGPVGTVRLKGAGIQGVAVAVPRLDIFRNGVGLVAVGDDEHPLREQPHRVVNDKGGIGHLLNSIAVHSAHA